ncbi:MAG: NCS2 family permease [Clostridiales bacterium]|jgi:AGZA family xanthine/uracil permease-like MFS transporter|nr:NCS2 family permease [Clostridiales bacterium]
MEKFFKLKEHNTKVSIEVMAGITTFMTMAYILIVNPRTLSAAGMDWGAVFTATALASSAGTLMMALLANYPFAMAPGMGLNAFFAYVVAAQYGWQTALLAVFVEGVIFILLSLVNVREAIFDAVPKNIKYAVSVGIGIFICFVGLQTSGIVVGNSATLVDLRPQPLSDIRVVLTLIGFIITSALVVKKIKGSLLWGILATYLIGLICQLAGLYQVNPDAGFYSLIPSGIVQLPPSIAGYNLFSAFSSGSFSALNILDFLIVMFAFLFVDIFDTIGTLIGVSSKANMLDKNGKLPKIKEALLSDAVGTIVGAVLGTSTVTTYVESAAGVAEGGRTGLTALVTAGLFLVALFFSPIFSVIPSFATAPALIVVGVYMISSVTKINFDDFTEAAPAFLAIVIMPLTYNISWGLVFSILSYCIIKLITGRHKEINLVMIIISALFLLKLFLG